MNSPIKLFSYFRSSSAYRVRIALHIKSIPFETIPVHLLQNGGHQHSEAYRKMNPMGQVPYLIDGQASMAQSMAILEYLEEEFPNPALLPKARKDRAVVRQMCELINSGIQPLQNLSVTQFLADGLKMDNEQRTLWVKHWIASGLQSFEALLQRHAGQYCFGDSITLADCFLVPQLFSAERFKVDVSGFPKMLEINKRCLQLTDFIKASPEKQPDFEP